VGRTDILRDNNDNSREKMFLKKLIIEMYLDKIFIK
jgi:hypothetical protein